MDKYSVYDEEELSSFFGKMGIPGSYDIQLYDYKRKKARWILNRFLYQLGKSNMTDGEYGFIQNVLTQIAEKAPEDFEKVLELKELREYLGRVYEEDPIPYKYFSFCNIDEETENALIREYQEKRSQALQSVSEQIKDMIDEDPPKSITPVESLRAAYPFFSKTKGLDLCASLKIDGINLRMFYVNGNLEYCCTRGRSGNVLDYTNIVKNIIPNYLEVEGKPFTGKIREECYVQPDKLEYLRSKYPSDYVVPRTAAKTMLSLYHDKEDMKFLKVIAFNSDMGMDLMDKLDCISKLGFDTVPREIIRYDGESFEDFVEWISPILVRFGEKEKEAGLKCDGLVVEVNSYNDFEKYKQDSNYDGGNIALKVGPWEPELYEGKVIKLVMYREEDKIQFNCKAVIEPVTVSSGIQISVVNMFNLGLVQKYGVREGDTIKFIFKNDNASQWVYQDVVSRLKGEG